VEQNAVLGKRKSLETVEFQGFFRGARYRTRIQEKAFFATNSVKFCDKQF
jgi:hypothetical protein